MEGLRAEARAGRAAGSVRARRGQSLVEFAVSLPLLMLLVMGMLDLGRAWQTQITLTDAARNTARVVAGQYGTQTSSQGPDDTTVCNELQNDVARLGSVTCIFTSQDPAVSPPQPGSGGVPKPTPGQLVGVIYPVYGNGSCTVCRSASGAPQHMLVYVYVFYDYQLLTPMISQLLGGPDVQTRAWASMRSSW